MRRNGWSSSKGQRCGGGGGTCSGSLIWRLPLLPSCRGSPHAPLPCLQARAWELEELTQVGWGQGWGAGICGVGAGMGQGRREQDEAGARGRQAQRWSRC